MEMPYVEGESFQFDQPNEDTMLDPAVKVAQEGVVHGYQVECQDSCLVVRMWHEVASLHYANLHLDPKEPVVA